MRLQELLQKRAALCDQQGEMLNKAFAEKRNLSVDEKSAFDKLDIGIAEIEEQIEREQKFQNRTSNMDNVVANAPTAPVVSKSQAPEMSFGEMLVGVARNAMGDRINIRNAPAGMSANVPSDGGFLISATRSNEILTKTYDTGLIASRCSSFEIGDYSDSLEIPYLNETSRADGSRWGGFRAYREGEAETPTSTKFSTGLWECRISDLKALAYVTERLLNDAPALESLIMQLLPQEFAFKLDDEILNGAGGASCKGVIGDPATVSVAKETGQAAASFVIENAVKMYTRCWGRARQGAAWFINQDVEPQLFTMALSVGTGGVPVFMPANGVSGTPYNTLFGRPIIPVEQCQTLGTVGDVVFGNFSEYALVRKGGLKSASSLHVKFITDEMTFKFSMRVNGKPKWNNVLTPFKGTNTLSPFVTLATRS
jgi:HK97 family phage major capsid protein